ncbi:cytosolic sulfotransferase 15-like [Prosopis cineraria]|uniref:cytosolic sulfotransferase 15-like n=1 Tax=Prosopis cineraria TaxID=364024 RepID=UPI0024101B8E|nr:cytosolic sulfotransferase 15-like [Prosopis cineraria]
MPLHQYNGFWLSKKHIQGILNFQNHYQAHDSDALLVTFPKSGTTWLKALTFTILNQSVKQSRCKIVYLCRNPKDLFVSTWRFVNKLLEPDAQRLVSIENAFEKFCQGVIGYGPFWDHMLEYHKESLKSPDKVMSLRFEELKSKPVEVLKDLAEFMGYGSSQEEEGGNVVIDILKLCSFESLSSMEVIRLEIHGTR